MRALHLAPLGLSILLCACSSVRTEYDFDPEADFSAWQSYAWYSAEKSETGDPRLDNPLLHERIREAIDRTLAASGYATVASGEPDFYVNFHVSTRDRVDVETINHGYAGGPYRRGWGSAGWGGVGWSETRVQQYEEGTLVIDFVDAKARRLVWRGSGSGRLSSNPKPERTIQRVNDAVKDILGAFPPK